MNHYLYSLLLISLATALVSLLSPAGERDGIAHGTRFLSSLLLIGLLLLPIKSGIEHLLLWQAEGIKLPFDTESNAQDHQEQLQEALDSTSKQYFTQMLTQTLELEFKIPSGELQCVVEWSEEENGRPTHVTLILSGSAIWKDAKQIERFTEELLGCPAQSAID